MGSFGQPGDGHRRLLSAWKRAVTPWLSIVVTIWCAGVALFSVRPAWSWFVVRRLRTAGVSPIPGSVRLAYQRMRERLTIARRVCVLQSSRVSSPVIVGCFRSVILIPASFVAGVPISQLEAILAHERNVKEMGQDSIHAGTGIES